MKTDNVILMRQAREALTGRWGLAIGTFLLYWLITGIVQIPLRVYQYQMFSFSIPLLGLVIAGPFALGVATFALALSRKQEARVEQLFSGFNRFGVAVPAYLLVAIYTLLWLLLLVVPGIIAAISYSQTFFIMAEDNDIRPSEAIDKSMKMMNGYKLKYFYLSLRFLGLALLCILTLGIGFLWLIPYMYVTCAKFYDDIKEDTLISTGV